MPYAVTGRVVFVSYWLKPGCEIRIIIKINIIGQHVIAGKRSIIIANSLQFIRCADKRIHVLFVRSAHRISRRSSI